jgi:hypothetical protein
MLFCVVLLAWQASSQSGTKDKTSVLFVCLGG